MSATMEETDGQGLSNDCGDVAKTCTVCVKQFAKYTCPRCNIQYCSLACYRHEKHQSCSEAFYKDCVVEELSHSTASARDKERVLEILQREQEARENDSEDSEDENDDIPELQDRLHGIDLDADAGAVWSQLTDKEKEEFSQMLEDGRLGNLVEVWTPWWMVNKTQLVRDAEENKSKFDGKPDLLSDIPDINLLLKKSKPSSDLRYNMVNVLYAYAFVSRLHNGGHQDCPLVAGKDLLDASPVLGEGKNCGGATEAVHLCLQAIRETPSRWDVTEEMTVTVLDDVQRLILGPGELSPLDFILWALSDIVTIVRSALKECKKEIRSEPDLKPLKKKLFLAEKKLVFLLSWAQRYGMASRELIAELRIEYELQKANAESVSKMKKDFESHWGGKLPQHKKKLIEEIL